MGFSMLQLFSEFVQTTSRYQLNDPLDATDNLNDTNAKMKLKVISLSSELNSRHSRNWRKDGQFKERFRTPYTKKEDLSIISFIKQRKRAKNEIGGNRMWKILEDNNVCPGRSWESMRERWRRFISKNLEKFNVTEDQVFGES